MAKKKKTSKKEKKEFNYSVELIGLLLIVIGIIGFGFGPVGAMIKKFAMFLVGEWWALILVLLLYLGFVMIIWRKLPNFFTTKLMGLYILILVVLTASHYTFIKTYSGSEIISKTMDSYQSRISTMGTSASIFTTGQESISIGGGIVGAGCACALDSLFDNIGTIIVLIALLIVAAVLMFDINLGELFRKLKDKIEEKRLEKEAEREEENNSYVDEEEELPTVRDLGKVQDLKNTYHGVTLTQEIPVAMAESIKNNAPEDAKSTLEFATPPQETVATIRGIYKLPTINLLDEIPRNNKINSNEFTKSNKIILERVLSDFDIKGTVVEIHVGPAVTQYEVAVHSGTKLNKVVAIDKEIALALAAKDVSIQAPIPGKSTVGIEIPNPTIRAVKIREVLGSVPKEQEKAKILVALGKDLMGRVRTTDITKMPHLLVAGSTGSGKSVCMNSIIASILMRYTPNQVKLVLVDPKKVEMSNYNGVPHLLWPVVTDPKKASVALQRIVGMMDERYEMFSETGVKKIEDYNDYVDKQKENDPSCSLQHLPYIVVIIDELADLMMVASKEVEASIQRITQLARAAGIHLIVATQRPSTNVITGVIKANIPSRISFAVASFIDSRTILDRGGAEKLLGKGDMLFMPIGENSPIRIQGCFITDDEVRRIIEYVCGQQRALYDETLETAIIEEHNPVSGDKESYDDPQYNEVYEFALETGKISASLIQRRFRFGYNRAARIMDLLEERGVVGPQNGSKPREVIVGKEGKGEGE